MKTNRIIASLWLAVITVILNCFPYEASASTITGPVYDPASGTTNGTVTVSFKSKQPVVVGSALYYTSAKTVTAVNGQFSVVLAPGNWSMQIGGYSDVLTFAVPNDNNTYSIASLLPNSLFTYYYSPTYLSKLGDTMQGKLSFGTTTLTPYGANNNTFMAVPDGLFMSIGTSYSGGTMRWNQGHAPNGEWEIISSGRICISPGYDSQGNAALQLGAPGYTHEEIYLTTDGTAGSIDPVNPANTQTNFTPSKILHFISTYKDTNGVVRGNISTGIRSETINQQGTTELRVYNPATNSNPAGNAIGAGIEQFAIGAGYTRTDGGQVFGVNQIASTSSGSYPIAWTNVIDSVYPTTASLSNYTTGWIGAGNKKEVIYWAQYGSVSMTWPSGWVQLNALPATLANNTVGKLSLVTTGTNDNSVLASWNSASFTPIYDTNLVAFTNASGIGTANTISALSRLVVSLKQNNLWSKLTAFYPMVGGSAASDKWNLVNTNLYPLTYSGTLYYTNGLCGDGNNGYADVGFGSSTFNANTNGMMFVNIGTTAVPLNNGNFMTVSGGGFSTYMAFDASPFVHIYGPGGNVFSAQTLPSQLGATNFSGFLGVNINNAAGTTTGYANGQLVASGAYGTNSIANSASHTLLFGSLSQNVNLTAAGFGSGFSPSDMTTFIAIVKQFETDLGR